MPDTLSREEIAAIRGRDERLPEDAYNNTRAAAKAMDDRRALLRHLDALTAEAAIGRLAVEYIVQKWYVESSGGVPFPQGSIEDRLFSAVMEYHRREPHDA